MNPPDSQLSDGVSRKKSPWRDLGVFVLKATVTASLIAWLTRSGALEFERLNILLDSTRVLAVTCLTWLSMQVLLATWRWRILLDAVGVKVSWVRAWALQITALFFNGLVPGNVGGDFVKNQSVLGNQGAKLIVMVLVERTVGLISLVWAGGVGIALSLERIREHPQLLPVVGALIVLILGSVLGPWGLLAVLKAAPRKESSRGPSEEGGFIRRSLGAAVDVFELIRTSRGTVKKGLAVSFLMHLGNMSYFLFLTRELGNPEATFGEIAMVFPLGMLSLILPISISGFGVGHVMFNEFFELLGLWGGATIFNVYIVAQLAPCLLGAVTYLFVRGRPADQGLAGDEAPTSRG